LRRGAPEAQIEQGCFASKSARLRKSSERLSEQRLSRCDAENGRAIFTALSS